MKTLRNLIVTTALAMAGPVASAQLYAPNGTVGTSSGPTTVGIGTSTPLMKLDIHKGDLIFTGDPQVTDNAFRFHHQYWLNNGALILAPASATDGTMLSPGWMFTYDGEFRSYGKIWAPEVEVKLPPFPDYVFEKDYNLISIAELEAFIDQNGHLPGLPSAEEVAKNGIGVGELQTKLLEKVEELTLYVIQLQKENQELREFLMKE